MISREVEVGQTVVSSMNVANLYTIADLDNMQVIGDVDEADIGRVKVGQNVTFSVDAYPDDVFHGQVTQVRLSPTTESNVVTYEVVVSASNADHKLIPGLTANLTIFTLSIDNALLLPQQAFTFQPREFDNAKNLPQAQEAGPAPDGTNQRRVWVVRDNKLMPVTVTIGQSNGIKTEILSGLKAGEVVATGYDESFAESRPDEGGRSPFAPRPPGGNRKK